jgi:CBS domain-containing protein
MKIEDVMTRKVITVRPDTPIHEAARLMTQHRVSGLPVVDETGRPVGIVSEGDLILRQKPRRAGSSSSTTASASRASIARRAA